MAPHLFCYDRCDVPNCTDVYGVCLVLKELDNQAQSGGR